MKSYITAIVVAVLVAAAALFAVSPAEAWWGGGPWGWGGGWGGWGGWW